MFETRAWMVEETKWEAKIAPTQVETLESEQAKTVAK